MVGDTPTILCFIKRIMMATFKNPNDPENFILIAKIHEWVKEKMKLENNSIVQVIEIDCSDPGCMDKATKILITSEGKPLVQYSIHKPLVYVRKPDIELLTKDL